MDLEWDEGKRQWTLETRGMDFADVEFFKFDTADTIADRRTDYGEVAWFPLATYMAAYAFFAGPNAHPTSSVSFH